jgi:DNA-binding LacI/PurR family transcriptional regulator
MDPFYFPPLVSGFVERAEELGYRVHLADRSEPLLEFLRFQELRVSAVACVLLDHADMVDADALLDKGVLVVAINHYGGARRISAVKADNQAGSYAAARYLLDIGHRRLAYLAGPRYNLDAGERRRGVQKAISDAGLPDHALTVYEGGFLEDSGYERGKEIVRRRRLPTAVISVSDLAAIGLLKAFREEGVRVPEDVSVCGFGDFRLAAYTAPTLTTVRLPIEELGRRSASALIDLYQGYRPEVHVVDCPLVLRDSTAAPRAADALDNTASTARSRAARQGRRFGARL